MNMIDFKSALPMKLFEVKAKAKPEAKPEENHANMPEVNRKNVSNAIDDFDAESEWWDKYYDKNNEWGAEES